MRSIIRVFSLAALVFFLGCNVENVSNSELSSDIQVKSVKECETAFAYYEDGCFLDDDFNRWGWKIGPLSEGFSGEFDIYAGAGKCKLTKGEFVGTLSVEYSEGTLTVNYDVVSGKCITETHLYAGNDEYPTLPNGKPTVAPGKYGNSNSYPDGVSSDSYTIDGLSGDIYVIAHAVVCDCIVECVVDAGTLTAEADSVCLDDGTATISAVPNGDAVIPDGYEVIYVLTEGGGLVIQDVSTDPSFTVDSEGSYTIHTLVYDPNTLDLSIVQIGVTTGFDVFGLLIDGGGVICASLDVTGAPVKVEDCFVPCTPDAGELVGSPATVCFTDGSATLTAWHFPFDENSPFVPDGYEVLYVLTEGIELVIQAVNTEPVFEVNSPGQYTIHTLVYDPNTLDLSIVEFGVTTGFDVFGLLIEGGGEICAALDVKGAYMLAVECDEN